MGIKGLKFRKIDLHIHTPASKCFKDKNVEADAIIQKSIEMRLDAIAITDHNSAEWIDIVKEKAKNTPLIIFPGVEITTSEGLHVVALFDINKSRSDIENFLGAIDITSDKYGATDAISKLNAEQVIVKIVERNGLAILAHIDSPKGVFKELDGISRLKLFNEAAYAAVECEGKCLPSDLKKERSFKRIPAFYLASDNPDPEDAKKHSIEGIGSKFSYFKMDVIDLEGLRQCFADSGVRIMLANEVPKYNYPQIVSLSISDGFLKDQHLEFMPGLNCIIGGKGTGKSLAVEFLRFALDQASCDAKILEDHSSKLEKQLGQNHKIMAAFQLENGALYEVTKSYEGFEGGKILCNSQCKNVATGEDYQGDIAALFPILAYSQLEVIKIAEREEAQLELIDKFIETVAFDDTINDLSTKLSLNDEKLSESILAKERVADLDVQINTLSTQITNIDELLKNPTFVELKRLEKKDVALNKYLSYINNVGTQLESTKENLSKLTLEEIDTELAEDSEISGAAEIATKAKDITVERLNAIVSEISSLSSSISESISICQVALAEKREEHERLLLEKGIDKNVEKTRVSLDKRKKKFEEEKKKFQSKVDEFESLFSERRDLLDSLDKVHKEYYTKRKEKYEELTGRSHEKLKLEISHRANRSLFKSELKALLKGAKIREPNIEQIVNTLLPRDFVDLILAKRTAELATKVNIAQETSTKIVEKLWSIENFEDILRIQHTCYPEDSPSIKFQKEDGNYYPLKELSVGQKCTALLIIALLEGKMPVIIDQPEDALDVASVWEDITLKLRGNKENRQFILTTHNSSVAVASDSDKFIVLEAGAHRAGVRATGAIDRNDVRKEVMEHLEGGDEPYLIRQKKYNITTG
ncbi:MAG: AAA family ATPase [Candidatus Methanoperedens sp.]|nr:AAA family ATPase [Candidatus Methanoperedens sp.]